jgi:hypothetical protein
MILYRAMCKEEFDASTSNTPLSFIPGKKFKWFGTKEFVMSRVQDGTFNNSGLVSGRYDYLIEYEVQDESLEHFSKCGYKEHMLSVKKKPLVIIKILNKYSYGYQNSYTVDSTITQ